MKQILVAVALLLLIPSGAAAESWPGSNGKIAFIGCGNGCEGSNGQSDIFDIGPKGGHIRRLTHSSLFDRSPSYSPNGKRIVYTCLGHFRGGGQEICIMDADGEVDGENRKVLTDDDLDQSDPSWSPNGRKIVFLQPYDDGDSAVGQGVFVMRRDGTDVKRIADNGFSPSWSPDGRKILFMSVADGRYKQDLFTIHPNGTHLRNLTDSQARRR